MKKSPKKFVCGALLLALSSSVVCHVQANPPGKNPTIGTPPTTQQTAPAAIPAALKTMAMQFNATAASNPGTGKQFKTNMANLKQKKQQLCSAIVAALDDGTLTYSGAYEIALLLMLSRTPKDPLKKPIYRQQLQELMELRNYVEQVQMCFDPNPKDGTVAGALYFINHFTASNPRILVF